MSVSVDGNRYLLWPPHASLLRCRKMSRGRAGCAAQKVYALKLLTFFRTVQRMELDLTFFLLAVPAVVIAGISKGGFGSGAAFVAAPILAIQYEPQFALGFLLPLLMVMDCTALRPYWGKWDWPNAKTLIIGAAGGVALAVIFYQMADADMLRILIGAISIAFVIYDMSRKLGLLRVPQLAFRTSLAMFTGVVAGFTSFVSHAGGPPVAMHLLSQGMNKTTYQATSVIVFWVINIFKAVPYAFLGIFTAETLLADLILAPVAVISAMLGVAAHRVVPERLFFAITYTLLMGAGGKLLYDGLT